ncbi:MAG: glycosyltransferase family 2 protein [Abditibacteriota bacterium]|nr:glycosyltransferase family 2 protein [Abditibacteriota bacterium]
MKTLSIVVPVFNERDSLAVFYREVSGALAQLPVTSELIFVDDGSSDGSLDVIRELAGSDRSVRYISFSRNFGKEAALLAGLRAASGDLIAVMDADLQDPPEMLGPMLQAIGEGYDAAAARRTTREGEPPIRSFFARLFYKCINRISKTEIVDGARDFRIMTRQVRDAVTAVTEYNRFSKGIMSWVGFRTKWLAYENTQRLAGETKWSFWKLLAYSVDGIVGFSEAPLLIASVMGIVFCAISLLMILVIIVKTLIWKDPVQGWPSLVCIVFFVSGVQLFCTGILGQYLAKTYMETKKRPPYIIRETTCDRDE